MREPYNYCSNINIKNNVTSQGFRMCVRNKATSIQSVPIHHAPEVVILFICHAVSTLDILFMIRFLFQVINSTQDISEVLDCMVSRLNILQNDRYWFNVFVFCLLDIYGYFKNNWCCQWTRKRSHV